MNKKLLSEICNSKFGNGFKQSLEEKTPEIVQVLHKNLGEERTSKIISFVDYYLNKEIRLNHD